MQPVTSIASKSLAIPPHSEAIISWRLQKRNHTFKWSVIQAIQNRFAQKRGIWTARTVVTADSENVPVRLFNSSSSTQTIRKDTLVALCEPIKMVRSLHREEVVTGHTRNQTTLSEIPDNLSTLFSKTTASLNPSQTENVCNLLIEFQHMFSTGPLDLGRTTLVKHSIDSGDAHPLRQPPRRLPLAKREVSEQEVKAMAEGAIIEPSSSPWASPIVLVSKRDGSYRYCINYSKVNDLTHKNSYPLPRIDSKLDALSGAAWFSTLDLKSGYWQVDMEEKDKEKTAFTSGSGLWQFRVMPMGLCNAAATFERLMKQVFVDMSWQTAQVYLEDIIVCGKTFEDELRHLHEAFTRLSEANLKLSPKKCQHFQRSAEFLGHTV